MKLVLLANGDCYQILEEFDDYNIIVYRGEILALKKSYPQEMFNISKIKEILVDVEKKNWRSQKRKEHRIKSLNQLLQSLISYNRYFKINQILQPKYDFDPICYAC
mgnify:CR=1 FL=1